MKEILANKYFLILASIWTVAILAIIGLIIYIGYKRSLARDKSFMDLLKSIHSQESSSSWIRWASSYVLFATFSLAFYQQRSIGSVQEGLIVGLVGLALTGKVAQKYLELKAPSEPKITTNDIDVDVDVDSEAEKMLEKFNDTTKN